MGARCYDAYLAGFVGGEWQQEEPQRATPKTPSLSTTPPRGASPARASSTEPTPMEEEGNSGAGDSATAPNAGGEGTSASQPGTGESLVIRLRFSLILFLGFIAPVTTQGLLR